MIDPTVVRIGYVSRFVLWLACLQFCAIAQAQTLHPADAAKTSAEVIERARRGESQDLNVMLDRKEIVERETEKRRARGLHQNDERINEETQREFDELKRSVFPGGKLDDVPVLEDHKHVPIVVVRVADLKSLAKLLSHPKVQSVVGNRRYFPAFNQSLPLIGHATAVVSGKLGSGLRIAVVDSGADLRLPIWSPGSTTGCRMTNHAGYGYPSGPYVGDAGCRISNALDFTQSNPYATPKPFWTFHDQLGRNGEGHGTNVAAIAAGVAPGAKIAALKVFYETTTVPYTVLSDWDAIKRAMQWVLDNHDKAPGKIVAVNLSLASAEIFSGECPGSLYAPYFERMRASGVIPVAASGNKGSKTGVSEPACAPGAVRVGSVYDSNFSTSAAWYFNGAAVCNDGSPKTDQVVCSSNSSHLLTLLAPGAYIDPYLGHGAGGTSQAAPHVAGAIAVLKQAFPNDSTNDTIARMVSTGKTIADKKNSVSKPRLNLASALSTNLVAGASLKAKVVVTAVVSLLIL